MFPKNALLKNASPKIVQNMPHDVSLNLRTSFFFQKLNITLKVRLQSDLTRTCTIYVAPYSRLVPYSRHPPYSRHFFNDTHENDCVWAIFPIAVSGDHFSTQVCKEILSIYLSFLFVCLFVLLNLRDFPGRTWEVLIEGISAMGLWFVIVNLIKTSDVQEVRLWYVVLDSWIYEETEEPSVMVGAILTKQVGEGCLCL